MAFKKLNSGNFENYPTLRVDEFVGQETRFKLMDYKENIGKFQNNVYTVDVDGKIYQLWGNSILNKYLPELEMGATIHVIYKGEVASKGGGNPYKNFDVFVDDGKEGEDELPETSATATNAHVSAPAEATTGGTAAVKKKNPVPF
jgi:hypothetical protein